MPRDLAKPLRFGIAGLWNTVFGYLCFVGFHFALGRFAMAEPVRYTSAVLLANAIAIPQAFLVYKHGVFRSQGDNVREFPRFVLSYLGMVAVNLVTLPVIVRVSGSGAVVGQAAYVVLAATVAFVLHGRFSFAPARTPPGGAGSG